MKLIDPSGKTNWKFIAIVAVFGLVAAGGIIFWYSNQPTSAPQPIEISNIKKPTPKQTVDTSTSSTTLTADWQTYRNEEFGFEVRYPALYLTEEYESCRPFEFQKRWLEGEQKFAFSVGNTGLTILNSERLDLAEYVDEYRKELISKLVPVEGQEGVYWGTSPGLPEKTTLAGSEAIKIVSDFVGASVDMPVAIFVQRGEEIFRFDYQIDQNSSHKACRIEFDQGSEELAESILSTFRFTE